MENDEFSTTFDFALHCVLAVVVIAALTLVMWLIGRNTLGEAVIALLYLVPIGYVTARWGQAPGIISAVAAALAFDFFFIPPFYTFTVGSLEGWLVLIIFLAVAILIVGRIQVGLSQAREREREAIFMYELTGALAGLRDRQAIARVMAGQLQRMYLAKLVQVIIDGDGPSLVFSAPDGVTAEGKPDRVVPIQAARDLEGEIWIWEGRLPLPAEDSRLLQSFAIQGALALERAREGNSFHEWHEETNVTNGQ
jgi:two-component system, OmpR family, sensor histidine kinase KdpD